MNLVERLLAGEVQAVQAKLAATPVDYHTDLIGLLGYYQLQGARDDPSVRAALSIMQLAEPYMKAPQLQVGIADAQWRIGDREAARARLTRVSAAHPDLAEAKALEATFDTRP